eukprot:gene466-414_t
MGASSYVAGVNSPRSSVFGQRGDSRKIIFLNGGKTQNKKSGEEFLFGDDDEELFDKTGKSKKARDLFADEDEDLAAMDDDLLDDEDRSAAQAANTGLRSKKLKIDPRKQSVKVKGFKKEGNKHMYFDEASGQEISQLAHVAEELRNQKSAANEDGDGADSTNNRTTSPSGKKSKKDKAGTNKEKTPNTPENQNEVEGNRSEYLEQIRKRLEKTRDHDKGTQKAKTRAKFLKKRDQMRALARPDNDEEGAIATLGGDEGGFSDGGGNSGEDDADVLPAKKKRKLDAKSKKSRAEEAVPADVEDLEALALKHLMG